MNVSMDNNASDSKIHSAKEMTIVEQILLMMVTIVKQTQRAKQEAQLTARGEGDCRVEGVVSL